MTDPVNWNFTAETNAQGRTYIKAYKMAWDKVAKKPKRALRRHVGRLLPDDRIAMSEKFLADHPQYRGQDWYWGASKRPITLAEYKNDFPTPPGTAADSEDTDMLNNISVGLTWAAYRFAHNSGILKHLKEVFGDDTGEQLLYLALYKLAGGTSMMTYDFWRQQVWLPKNIRLSGQKISEILQSVTKGQINDYFQLRHLRQGEVWDKIFEKQPELKGKKIEYALDSTSISSYSDNPMAQFGHSKQDDSLKQINLTVVCDQRSGEIVFAYLYDGSVNDVVSLQDVLWAMKEANFDLSNNILVTDRGYNSLINVQKMINIDLSFVQGVKRQEDVIKRAFKKHRVSLMNGAFYNGHLRASAFTYKEEWEQGQIKCPVYVHLYRLDERYEQQRALIWKNVAEMIELKQRQQRVPSDQWDNYGRYLVERNNDDGSTSWMIDTAKMDEAAERATQFVLRSNCISNPFEALEIYRQRGFVEQDFNQMKNWVDGDRLRVGAKAVQGKMLVTVLATTLRMMMLFTAKSVVEKKPGYRIPNDSIDYLLKSLELVKADKRKNANAWVRNTIPAKRRRCFELLELPEPPRTLLVGSR